MIGCIIQARTGSTRLPGKTMMPIDENDTVLSFGIKQVQSSKLIEKIVIATTDLSEDDLIFDYVKKIPNDIYELVCYGYYSICTCGSVPFTHPSSYTDEPLKQHKSTSTIR